MKPTFAMYFCQLRNSLAVSPHLASQTIFVAVGIFCGLVGGYYLQLCCQSYKYQSQCSNMTASMIASVSLSAHKIFGKEKTDFKFQTCEYCCYFEPY